MIRALALAMGSVLALPVRRSSRLGKATPILFGAMLAIALAGGSGSVTAATIAPRPPAHWGATGVPIPPPPVWATPALLARFISLYSAFVHQPPQGRLSFGEFLLAKGVTNPELFAKMMSLYHWYLQPGRTASSWSTRSHLGR